jgi:Protein of unknown function (DUF2478)
LQACASRYIVPYTSLHEACRVKFDAQCDVAAVVYGAGDDPDRLLIEFTDDLRRAGLRPVGVVQAGRSCQAENPRLAVVVLPGGEAVCLVTDPSASAAGCHLDAGRLAEPERRLAAAIEEGADLVVINRLGLQKPRVGADRSHRAGA